MQMLDSFEHILFLEQNPLFMWLQQRDGTTFYFSGPVESLLMNETDKHLAQLLIKKSKLSPNAVFVNPKISNVGVIRLWWASAMNKTSIKELKLNELHTQCRSMSNSWYILLLKIAPFVSHSKSRPGQQQGNPKQDARPPRSAVPPALEVKEGPRSTSITAPG